MMEIYQKRELEARYLEFMEKRFVIKDGEMRLQAVERNRRIKTATSSASKIAKYHETSEIALCLLRCRKDMFGLPPESADDYNPLPMDFHVILRSEFDTKERDIFVKELEARVKMLWPNSSFSSVSCGSHVRESKCERAIVFSSESNDCGEWLGKWFTGCVVVFCDHKHVLA
ncbi:hypothetical protein CRE_17511 [Caenorhabditis remanei]|uniref:Uncharacterized protein n=1 Tax=Caenorhabditis remanei TaxID=31234 RepID=E3N7T5_CAERE|nr:hypothetical protein CRE_17511 [Caenorhabditis remanei]